MTTNQVKRLYLFQLATMGAGLPVPAYLIQTGDGINVLVDTGFPASMMGTSIGPGGTTIIKESDYIINQLAALGLKPGDINYLICTHFDPDHAGNHDLFPDAELVVQRQHYEVATKSGLERFARNREHWGAPNLHYRLVDGDTQLLPGIELIETSGHVPGHQSVLVRLPETGPVLLPVDAIPFREHLDVEKRTNVPFDMDLAGVIASTHKLLDLVRREGVTLIVHGHDAAQWQNELKKAPEFYS